MWYFMQIHLQEVFHLVGHLILNGLVWKSNGQKQSKGPWDVNPNGHHMYYKCVSFVNKNWIACFIIYIFLAPQCVTPRNLFNDPMKPYAHALWSTIYSSSALSTCIEFTHIHASHVHIFYKIHASSKLWHGFVLAQLWSRVFLGGWCQYVFNFIFAHNWTSL